MTLYLDASVIVPLIVTEAKTERILAWIADQHEPFSVARLAIGEAGSAISRRRRMNHLTAEQGERALAALDTWLRLSTAIIDHVPGDIIDATQWVRRPVPKLLVPDAIHLATCQRLGHRFATDDRDLATIADLHRIAWVLPE